MAPGTPRRTSFRTRAQAGVCPLRAELKLIGEDVLVSLWGGTGPHIGAIAVAVPRPGRDGRTGAGATLSMYTFPGHRDDEVAGMLAREICGALQRTTVVTAGIHVDRISPEGIEKILRATEGMCFRLIKKVRAQGPPDQD